ncbi:MAG: hypothetical protein ABIO67_10035 [Mycobacteriales bacterium]
MSTVDPSDALSRRIEELAAFGDAEDRQPAPAAPAVDLGAVRGEIAGVRADLGSLRAELGGVRADLDGLGGRLTGSVAASRAETGTLVRRMTEVASRLDSVGGRVDEVRSGLPTLAREVREGLDSVPAKTGSRLEELSSSMTDAVGRRVDDLAADVRRTLAAALEQDAGGIARTQAAMADTRGAIESRLAVLEDTLDSMTERIESLSRDGAARTTDKLNEVEERLTAVQGRVDAVGTSVVADVTASTERRIAALTKHFDATHAELRKELAAGLAESAAQTAAVTASVDKLGEVVRSALELFSTTLDAGLTTLGSTVAGSLTEGRTETRKALDSSADTLKKGLAGQRDAIAAGAEAQKVQLTALQSAVEERVDNVRSQLTGAATQLREDVVAEIGTVRPQVEELAATTAATKASFGDLRVELADALETLRERVGQSGNDNAKAVRAALAELKGDVEKMTGDARTGVLDRIEERFGVVSARLAEVSGTVEGGANAARETQERVASLQSGTDEVRRALVGLGALKAVRDAKAARVVDAPSKAAADNKDVADKADGDKAPADDAPKPAAALTPPAKKAAKKAAKKPAKKAVAKKAPAKKAVAKKAPAKVSGLGVTKTDSSEKAQDRRGRLDAMPQVPSVSKALDAATGPQPIIRDVPQTRPGGQAGATPVPRPAAHGTRPGGAPQGPQPVRPVLAGQPSRTPPPLSSVQPGQRPAPAGQPSQRPAQPGQRPGQPGQRPGQPQQRPGQPGPQGQRPAPTEGTSWAKRPEPTDDEDGKDGRGFFRRRKK